jgi:hypothetical protein
VDFYNKLNANERLVVIGAVIVIISFLVGIVGSYGFGANTIALLAAIAAIVIYWLKYSPTQNVTWPMPVQTIVLGISAVAAVLSILGVLPSLSFLGALGLYMLAAIGTVVGAVIMTWGAWQDYQAMPKTTPPSA